MSLADYVVLGMLAAAVACAVIYIIRRKKRGRGGCADCPYAGQCGDRECKK